MTGIRVHKKTACWAAAFLFIILFSAHVSVLFGYQPISSSLDSEAIGLRRHVSKILTLLELRSFKKDVLDKVTGKIYAMNDKELRLMSSLCDRISRDGDSAAAKIAFSLLTAMIVLS